MRLRQPCHLDTAVCARGRPVGCAGKWLAQEVKDAIEQKRAMLEVPRGVYRITDEPLMIIDSVGLTIRAPGVELIAEVTGALPAWPQPFSSSLSLGPHRWTTTMRVCWATLTSSWRVRRSSGSAHPAHCPCPT